MRGHLTIAAALLSALATPALAQDNEGARSEVIAAADAFFDALRSKDAEKLAAIMRPDGTIMIDDRMFEEREVLMVVPNAAYLKGRDDNDDAVNEVMQYESVHIDGNIAQVWGPYRFTVNGETTHCGINSMTFIRGEGEWMLGNSSFSIVPPEKCGSLNAPDMPQ